VGGNPASCLAMTYIVSVPHNDSEERMKDTSHIGSYYVPTVAPI